VSACPHYEDVHIKNWLDPGLCFILVNQAEPKKAEDITSRVSTLLLLCPEMQANKMSVPCCCSHKVSHENFCHIRSDMKKGLAIKLPRVFCSSMVEHLDY